MSSLSRRQSVRNRSSRMESQNGRRNKENDVAGREIYPLLVARNMKLILLIVPSPSTLESPLLMLPSSPYMLHVIDRRNGFLICSSYLTSALMGTIERSKAYQHHKIVFSSETVDLSSESQQQKVISNLLKTLSSGKGDDALVHVASSPNLPPMDIKDLLALIDHINVTYEPMEADLEHLLLYAEQYNFNLTLHPEYIATKKTESTSVNVQSTAHRSNVSALKSKGRVHVEMYAPHVGYVGGITLAIESLERKLCRQPKLFQRIRYVRDEFQLIPKLPQRLIGALWNVLSFLRLEIFYDILGKFAFELYKQYLLKQLRTYAKTAPSK